MSVLVWVKNVFTKVADFSQKYPLSRGMASYAAIWPVGSMIQQTVEGRETFDYWRIGRFCLYGSCYVAPTLNIWLKIARNMWPEPTIRAALAKATIEQISYTPFAMISFYFCMTLLEGKGFDDAKAEVEDKFLPTYKVGVCVWPVLQTINYTMIAEHNRVPFVSVCSLVWTSFLAYMKHLQTSDFNKPYSLPPEKYYAIPPDD